jgi:hypothetical protein
MFSHNPFYDDPIAKKSVVDEDANKYHKEI